MPKNLYRDHKCPIIFGCTEFLCSDTEPNSNHAHWLVIIAAYYNTNDELTYLLVSNNGKYHILAAELLFDSNVILEKFNFKTVTLQDTDGNMVYHDDANSANYSAFFNVVKQEHYSINGHELNMKGKPLTVRSP